MLGVGYGHETLRRVASLAELAELAVLVAMSLVLVIRVIFRPTAASIMNTRSATAAREETGRQIVGPAPTRAAVRMHRSSSVAPALSGSSSIGM